jgi:hypothetical protein
LRSRTFDQPKELGLGELAERSGVALSALHFYEAKGLIHSVRSTGQPAPLCTLGLAAAGGHESNADDAMARQGAGPHFE